MNRLRVITRTSGQVRSLATTMAMAMAVMFVAGAALEPTSMWVLLDLFGVALFGSLWWALRTPLVEQSEPPAAAAVLDQTQLAAETLGGLRRQYIAQGFSEAMAEQLVMATLLQSVNR